MTITDFLQNLCTRLSDYFYRSFGAENNSQSGDLSLPIDAQSQWQVVLTMSKPCKLVIQNADPANQLQITFNRTMLKGFTIEAGDILTLDDIMGTLYARASSAVQSSLINFVSIAIND